MDGLEAVKVPLSNGRDCALVDVADFEAVSVYRWSNIHGYAYAFIGGRKVCMHRFLMKPSDCREVDHVNGNKLDNRRSNLRICTASQNHANSKRAANNTSGFKGVVWENSRGKFRAEICVHKRKKTLGRFDDPRDAARAYNRAALQIFGDFARLNPEVD